MLITEQIEHVRNHFELLQRRSAEVQNDDLVLLALEELGVALEEMQAAEDELRRQNEQLVLALRSVESERRRYQELFDAAPDGYVVTDLNGTIREANAATADMLQTAASFLIGKPIVVFIDEDDRRAFRNNLAQAERGQGLIEMDVRLHPRDGAPIDVEARAVMVYDEVRALMGLRWLLRDVTRRKQIENEIRLLNTGLENRVQERTAQLAEAIRAKDELLLQEQAARQETERARNRVLLLAQSSEHLASSLDYETTLASVARLLIGHLADSCIIFLAGENDDIHQVATAHLDSSGATTVGDLAGRNDAAQDYQNSVVAEVLKTGKPIIEHIAGDDASVCGTIGGIRFGDLCWGSMMVVPLVVRGTSIGAIAVAAEQARRPFDTDDLELAQELANRAAQAIDSARLFNRARMEIAERRQADAALQTINRALQALIQASPLAIIQIDLEGIVKLWSPAASTIFGWGRDEVIERRMPIADADAFEIFLQRIRSAKNGKELEVKCLKKDGSTIDVGLWTAPLHDKDGAVTGILSLIADFSERKRADDELQHAKEIAEQANRAKDQFLAVLSHELRTPLSAVVTAVQVLADEPEMPSGCQFLVDLIGRNIELEARLIDDLLDITKVARGKLELHLEVIDTHVLLQNVVETYQHDITGKNIDLQTDFRAAHHHASADAGRLQQVFGNLLQNACKFTPEGGRITVWTESNPDGTLRVGVADTGIGIETDVLPRIFNAFEQGEQTITRRFGGLGLGLAVSKSLIDMHGGRLTVESRGHNQGSTFVVELKPVWDSEQESGEDEPGMAQAQAQPRPRMLLVDDHHDTSSMLKLLLERHGYEVYTAGSVQEALHVAAANPFDILISDIGLPDGSGLDLIRALKEHGDVQGIALSGFGMEQDIQRSREAGFQEHLTKPVSFWKLQEAIQRLIG